MKNTWLIFSLFFELSCAKRHTISSTNPHNVVAIFKDSPWFATGKAIRLIEDRDEINSVTQFNMQIVTDIDYQGNVSAIKSSSITGCIEDCIPTQRLHLYNIPLRKGKHKLAVLDKRRTVETEKTTFWLMIDGAGVYKKYQYTNAKSSWIRINNYDQQSKTIEGQFAFSLRIVYDSLLMSNQADRDTKTIRFTQGIFKVKLVDVFRRP